MVTFTTLKTHTRVALLGLAALTASALTPASAQRTKLPSPAANLDQIRNGAYDAPIDPASWVNGNAGAQNAHYVESHSIGYRARLSDIPANTTVTLTLGYDIRHSSRNAIDYLTNYQRLLPHDQFHHPAEAIDPTIGTSYSGAPTSTFLIPKPSSAGSPVTDIPGNSWQALYNANAEQLKMALWGPTGAAITNIQYVTPQGSLTDAQSETRINVTFYSGTFPGGAATGPLVLGWGGHIADRREWGYDANGVPNSAGGISGSPYHMRLIGWTLNNLGNQDRSLSADAVRVCEVTAGSINNSQTICEGTSAAAFTNVTSGTTTSGNTLSYRWESASSCDGPWTPIANSNSATFDPDGSGTLSAGTYYYHRVAISSGDLSCEAPSNCVYVTVNAKPATPTLIVHEALLCNTDGVSAPSVEVCSPVNGTYTFTQGTTTLTFVYPTDGSTVVFGSSSNPLTPGVGFTVSVTVDGCTSDDADCDNVVSSCTSGTNKASAPKEEIRTTDVNARIFSGAKTRVLAAPNPFTDRVRFTLQSDISGQGSLEIYNTMGQKLATVYQGYVEAGKPLNKEYTVQRVQRANLIYVFRVGDQKTTGKLLNW